MSTNDADPLDPLAEEFLTRQRAGEHPQVEEYAKEHPELASRIRSLFPALVAMEAFGSVVSGPAQQEHLGPGSVLGEYRLVRELGRGGMGVVYEAIQETLARVVALKVLAFGPRGTGQYLERFRREARTAARLHHTNIVPVFGVGADRGIPFYAMQFIHGQSLSAVLEDVRRLRGVSTDTPSPPGSGSSSLACQTPEHYHREATRLVMQAADALAYAHGQGVLHRDIKPSNLLLDTDGTFWIADFGLAKADDSDDDLTETGNVVGTTRYLAPERFRGQCDTRSDIYSLGATLYEMLALRPAFNAADRVHLTAQIAGGDAPPLRELVPAIPRDLDLVVRKAMALDPDDRYQHAADFTADLRNVLEDRPISIRKPSLPMQAGRWCRRNPVVAGLSAAVFLLLASVAAVTVVKNRELTKSLQATDEALKSESKALDDKNVALQTQTELLRLKDAARTEANERLREALIMQAQVMRLSNSPGQRLKSLEALKSASQIRKSDDLRSHVFETLGRLDIETVDPKTVSPEFSPTHDLCATFLGTELEIPLELEVRSINSNTLFMKLVRGTVPNARQAFSPDGRLLLTADGQRVGYLWDWKNRRVLHSTPKLPAIANLSYGPVATAWSQDSKRLFLLAADRHIHVLDTNTGKIIDRWDPGPDVTRLSPHPDGQTLAVGFAGGQSRVELRSVVGGALKMSLVTGGRVTAMAWSATGQGLAVGTFTGGLYFWNAPDGRIESLRPTSIANSSAEILYLEYSPNQRLVLGSNTRSQLLLTEAARPQVLVIPFLPKRFHAGMTWATFDRSGQWISLGGGDRLFRVIEPAEYRCFASDESYEQISLSGDGSLAGVVKHTRGTPSKVTWSMWDMVTGRFVGDVQETDFLWQGFVGTGREMLEISVAEKAIRHRPINVTREQCIALEPPVHVSRIPSACDFEIKRGLFFLESTPKSFAVSRRLTTQEQIQASNAMQRGKPYARADQPFAFVWPRNDPNTYRTFKHPNPQQMFRIGPEERNFLSFGAAKLFIWNTDSDRPQEIACSVPTATKYSPDGRFLSVVAIADTTLYETGSWRVNCKVASKGQMKTSLGAAFAPGSRIFAVSSNNGIELRRCADGALLVHWPHDFKMWDLAFSADGRYLVAAGEGVHVWDLPSIRRYLREFDLDWQD